MPVILCPESIPCIDPSTPVTNFSTEASDPNEFLSLQWPVVNPNNPVGGDTTVNKMPNQWNADGCLSECESTISQQDADECAARQAALCLNQNAGNLTFTNDAQSCTINCPDGNPFTFVVGAGIIASTTKVGANAQAHALACSLVKANLICIDDFNKEACVNSAFTVGITAESNNSPMFFSVQGSLPPGLSLTQTGAKTATLAGTPTQSGTFFFSVVASDGHGNSMVKGVSFCVVDISPSTLPNALQGTSYSQTLTAVCGASPLSWQVTSGALPPGLSLDEGTGIISGTPTLAGNYNFTVTVQTAAT